MNPWTKNRCHICMDSLGFIEQNFTKLHLQIPVVSSDKPAAIWEKDGYGMSSDV